MTDGVVKSLGVGRFLDWRTLEAAGAAGGVLICWDKRSLEMLEWEEGGDFNVILAQGERSRQGRVTSSMRSWLDQFSNVTQKRLSRPISDHFLIIIEGGGKRRGPSPFRFENMWLKVEGFKDLLRSWWQGMSVSGRVSYKLATKLKGIKQNLQVWNKEVFGNLESNKLAALQQVDYWDQVESERSQKKKRKKVMLSGLSWRRYTGGSSQGSCG
ncbi:hypothetical protein CK203_090153 [Vitis vinifera]|uniref:Reverse transcriptase zinc-binding domain-containing protein n=1 Tax=Vitis vinifera TaxID=29760 RepID=A0A438D7I3_VITVI|nr:hypothetical protein CK203_090153 [Vitis vinifera]